MRIISARLAKPRPRHHSGLIWRPRWWRAPLFLAMLAASMMEPVLVQAAGVEAGFSSSQHRFQISVLSSRPDMVSGGDALMRVDVPRSDPIARVQIFRNDHDVTDAFTPIPAEHALVGLVDGFELGENQLVVRRSGQHRPVARLTIVNHPITGPIFSGPHQQPFVCKTTRPNNDLGQPLVDNQEGIGFPVFDPDGGVIGWSRDCSAHDRVGYMYRATDGTFRPMPPDGSRPPDLAQTTLLDGRRVDYIVRWERGTINRFIYSIAMLAPFGEDPRQPDRSFWNGRLLFSFEGGVGIGRQQGEMSMSGALFDQGLSLGYVVIYSTGTRTGVHYNLQVGGETALMVKEAFIKRHGVPLYTVGVGGSGGGIQQYIYAQNHPGLLDAGIPSGHGHAGHSHRRLRAARVLHGRDGCGQSQMGNVDQSAVAGGAECERYGFQSVHTTIRQHRMRQQLAGPDTADVEPSLRNRRTWPEAYEPAGRHG